MNSQYTRREIKRALAAQAAFQHELNKGGNSDEALAAASARYAEIRKESAFEMTGEVMAGEIVGQGAVDVYPLGHPLKGVPSC